jgi:hypothetical protein
LGRGFLGGVVFLFVGFVGVSFFGVAAFFDGAFLGAGFFAGVFAGFSLSGEESPSMAGALAARGRRVRGGRATF